MPVNRQGEETRRLIDGIRWVGSQKINAELDLFVECLLDRIQKIYPPLTSSQFLVTALVPVIQELTENMEARARKVDWIDLLVFRIPFILLRHSADYRVSCEKSRIVRGGHGSKVEAMQFLQPRCALDKVDQLRCEYLAPKGDLANKECLEIASSEEAYQRYLATRFVRKLLPKSSKNGLFRTLLTDVLASLVIRSIIAYLADPSSINILLIQALGGDTALLDVQDYYGYTESSGLPHAQDSYLDPKSSAEKQPAADMPVFRALSSVYRHSSQPYAGLHIHRNIRDRLAGRKIQDSIARIARNGKNLLKASSQRQCIQDIATPSLHKSKKLSHDQRVRPLALHTEGKTHPLQPTPHNTAALLSLSKKTAHKPKLSNINKILKTLHSPRNKLTTYPPSFNIILATRTNPLAYPILSQNATRPQVPHHAAQSPKHCALPVPPASSSGSLSPSPTTQLIPCEALPPNTPPSALPQAAPPYEEIPPSKTDASTSHTTLIGHIVLALWNALFADPDPNLHFLSHEHRNYASWLFQICLITLRFDDSQNRFAAYLLSTSIALLCSIFRTALNR